MKEERKNHTYCISTCPIGKKKQEELLAQCNSPFEAALDMQAFVRECEKTCERYKNASSKA